MTNNKQLFTIFLIIFIDLLGFGIILPLLPFIAEKYGANPLQIGLLTASYSLFQFLSAPILGRLSDRFGRKKLLIISQIGSTLGYLLLGFANALPIFFLARIIDGITGGNISIAQAYIADITSKKDRAKGMGLIGAAFGLGFIVGPALGGLLTKISYSAPAFLAALISLITVLTTNFFLVESVDLKQVKNTLKTKLSLAKIFTVFAQQSISLLIITFFGFNLAISLFQGNFTLWTEKKFGFGPTANGWLFTYAGIIVVIIQLKILPYLVRRFPEKKLLKWATLCTSFGLFILTLIVNPLFFLFVLPFISFGNGLSNPLIQSLISENIAPNEYGLVMGVLQSSGSLGRILGPVIGGELFLVFNYNVPFIFGSLIVFIIFVLLVKKLK